ALIRITRFQVVTTGGGAPISDRAHAAIVVADSTHLGRSYSFYLFFEDQDGDIVRRPFVTRMDRSRLDRIDRIEPLCVGVNRLRTYGSSVGKRGFRPVAHFAEAESTGRVHVVSYAVCRSDHNGGSNGGPGAALRAVVNSRVFLET